MEIETRFIASPSLKGLVRIVVLKPGQISDYAAYEAVFEYDPMADQTWQAEWTARHGHKLGFTEAQAIFPHIKAERYRK